MITTRVDVVRDWVDYLMLAFGVLGTLAALVAIFFAIVAQKDASAARRAVTDERWRLLRLEILKELLFDLDEIEPQGKALNDPGSLRRYQHRLALLEDTALPFWRAVMRSDWRDDIYKMLGYDVREERAIVEAHANLAGAERNGGVTVKDRARAAGLISALHREFDAEVRQKLEAEVNAAIRECLAGHA
jgi:hypothetical protein